MGAEVSYNRIANTFDGNIDLTLKVKLKAFGGLGVSKLVGPVTFDTLLKVPVMGLLYL